MRANFFQIAAIFLTLMYSATGAVLTFEEFAPPNNDFINVFPGTPYQGVAFQFAAVANDQLVAKSQHASDYWETDGTGPFLTPHSGHVALFNVGDLNFATDQVLTGLWVARPNLGPTGVGGSDHITLTAYFNDTPLTSLSIDLTSTTPVFWDTSSLLQLPGITRYSIAPAQPGKVTGYFVADDLQFATMSLNDACPCHGPWRNHGDYVRCVRAAVSLLTEDQSLTSAQAKQVLKELQHSDCGQNRD
jgi:hypothetical protein